jgi:hypothetical protein
MDQKREGATEDVLRKYCVCMNNAMGDDESKSVTEWEKTHPDETKACDKEAGWKYVLKRSGRAPSRGALPQLHRRIVAKETPSRHLFSHT